MRPNVRRIDLTQTPTTVEVWPSLDWLDAVSDRRRRADVVELADAPRRSSAFAGPRGRSGLWDAMANAVQRARESSLGDGDRDEIDDPQGSADVIEMTVDTPHLAYLARVACSGPRMRRDLPGADIIAFVDGRARDASQAAPNARVVPARTLRVVPAPGPPPERTGPRAGWWPRQRCRLPWRPARSPDGAPPES